MTCRTGWPFLVGTGGLVVGLLVGAPGSVPPAGAWVDGAAVGASVPALTVSGVPYSMVDLGTLGGSHSDAVDVNRRGQVAGDADTTSGARHAFLWDPVSGMRDLGTLGGSHSYAVDVNDRGQVVGPAMKSTGGEHAFLWDPVAGMRDLGTLGGDRSLAVAVNERGQVAGDADTTSGARHAFLWDPVAGMTDLGTLGGASSYAAAVNDGGQVVGQAMTSTGGGHAFLWDPVAGMTDLGTLGGDHSHAVAVNDGGQVVGSADTAAGQSHAFLWDPVAGMRDLGTLGTDDSYAVDVNDSGQVAGYAIAPDADFRMSHAFLWDPVAGMRDLGTLGGGYSNARDVNGHGQVVGTFSAPDDDPRWTHAFLWDPVAGMTDLGTSGDDFPEASAVNDRGQVAGIRGGHAVLWTPAELTPRARLTVAQAGYGNKLRVDVDPDRVGDSWTFRVQKRIAGVWKTLPGRYQTRGTEATRTLTLGPGRFRVRVVRQYGYAGTTSPGVRLTAPRVRVWATTIGYPPDTLKVNVDPNKRSGYWTFRVQKRTATGWKTLPTRYCTRGRAETKTLDLPKGTYRAKVYAKYGYLGAKSNAVILFR